MLKLLVWLLSYVPIMESYNLVPLLTSKKVNGVTLLHYTCVHVLTPHQCLSYANANYALAQALWECHSLQDVGLTYDVACQYMVHLVTWFQQYFPHMVLVVSQMTALIPKMHLASHKLDCRYHCSLNFMPGMGQKCGELIETVWSELNQANRSIKEMNHRHHHDTLDDLYSDRNWSEVQNMSQSWSHCHTVYMDDHWLQATLSITP